MARRNRETIPWKIWVPERLALRVELLYCSSVTGRPNYGARSHLIVALLEEFVRSLDANDRATPGAIKAFVDRIIAEGEQGTKHPEGDQP